MLRVDLRELRLGPVDTVGQVPADHPALAGLELDMAGPVEVDGRLQATGEGEYLWRADLTAEVNAECRRCLAPMRHVVSAALDVLFSTDPDATEDPSVYPLALTATHVDLADAVREELALAAPAFVLCREECAGLCPVCGADLNAGPCSCAGTAEPT